MLTGDLCPPVDEQTDWKFPEPEEGNRGRGQRRRWEGKGGGRGARKQKLEMETPDKSWKLGTQHYGVHRKPQQGRDPPLKASWDSESGWQTGNVM